MRIFSRLLLVWHLLASAFMFDVKSNLSMELMSVIVLEQFVRNSAKYCSASASSGLIGCLSGWRSCKLPLFQSQVQNTP